MMRSNRLSLLLIVLLMASAISAQEVCPTISVVGPAGLTAPGEMARFDLNIEGELPPGAQFAWTVAKASVDDGQGTRSIGVRARPEYTGLTVTAIVKIAGLPAGCPDTASESYDILPWDSAAVLLERFSVPVESIAKTELENAAREISRLPNDQMYIIEYFPPSISLAVKEKKLANIRAYFKDTLNFDTSRVTIVTADLPADQQKPLTMIYRIPPGAETPSP